MSCQSTFTSHQLNATQISLVERFIRKWPKLVIIFDYIAYYTFIDPDLYWKELSENQCLEQFTFILWFEIHNDNIVFFLFFISLLWYDAKFIRTWALKLKSIGLSSFRINFFIFNSLKWNDIRFIFHSTFINISTKCQLLNAEILQQCYVT